MKIESQAGFHFAHTHSTCLHSTCWIQLSIYLHLRAKRQALGNVYFLGTRKIDFPWSSEATSLAELGNDFPPMKELAFRSGIHVNNYRWQDGGHHALVLLVIMLQCYHRITLAAAIKHLMFVFDLGLYMLYPWDSLDKSKFRIASISPFVNLLAAQTISFDPPLHTRDWFSFTLYYETWKSKAKRALILPILILLVCILLSTYLYLRAKRQTLGNVYFPGTRKNDFPWSTEATPLAELWNDFPPMKELASRSCIHINNCRWQDGPVFSHHALPLTPDNFGDCNSNTTWCLYLIWDCTCFIRRIICTSPNLG